MKSFIRCVLLVGMLTLVVCVAVWWAWPSVGYVGVPHDVVLNVPAMFGRNVGLAGGVAPVRAYIDDILPDVLDGSLQPGKVFDQTLPLDQVATAYQAMDERTAIKSMLTV